MEKVRYLICGMLIFGAAGTHGYELSTHARLTEQAYDKSDLPKRMADYGIDEGSDNPFGSIYYDVTVSSVSERAATAFEAGRMTQGEGGTPPRSIKGWLANQTGSASQLLSENSNGCSRCK